MQNKQQDYLKQRERLKYVTQNHVNKKILDPDIMIEQLISDKETFKFNLESQSPYILPKWLQVQNNLVPAVYEQVWQAVKLSPMYEYCDTNIITQLFTTSGLSLDRLGLLWSLANVSLPGFLTQQELYVMLALIALVQTGYNVKDISIISSINHPILPQLDYSFLNITVANPAINRNVTKQLCDPKTNNSLTNALLNNTVPIQTKSTSSVSENTFKQTNAVSSLSDLSSVFDYNSHTVTSSSQHTFTSEMNYVSRNRISEMCNSDIDVTFVIPEARTSELSNSTLSSLVEQIVELNVDSPISNLKVNTNVNFTPDMKRPYVIQNKIQSPMPQNIPNETKKFNFSSVFDFSSSVEPKSLDLPVFGSENGNVQEEDEFTEFQSATIMSTVDEYNDFQSASPIAKDEFNNFLIDRELKSSEISMWNTEIEIKSGSVVEETSAYKSSLDADKYDVFRTLMEHENENKDKLKNYEQKNEGEVEEEEEEEDEEEFGEFFAADVNPIEKKPVSIKHKCLEACLRLLNEGLSIFSGISREETLREVLADGKGYRYFNQLKIVYETSQRFQRQFENTDLNNALQCTWSKLSSFTKYIPEDELLDDMYSEEDVDASLCKLCETKCDLNCVRYAGNYYHVTCINLFLHFVEDSEISTMLNL